MFTTKTIRRYYPAMVSPWTMMQENGISVSNVARAMGTTSEDVTRMLRSIDGRQTVRQVCAELCQNNGTTIIFR